MAKIVIKMDVRDIPKKVNGKANPNWDASSENKEYALAVEVGTEKVEYPGWTPEESFKMLLNNMQMHEPEPDFLAAIMDEAGYVRDSKNMIVGWSKKPKKKG